ncbi:hypothetical protein SRHO_G00174590 [Serrasalmus rhombeus]
MFLIVSAGLSSSEVFIKGCFTLTTDLICSHHTVLPARYRRCETGGMWEEQKCRKKSGRRDADPEKVSARPFGSRERANKLQQVRAAVLFPDSAYCARRWRFARAVLPRCLPFRTYFEDFVEVVGLVSGWWLELVHLTLCTRLSAGLSERGRVSNAGCACTAHCTVDPWVGKRGIVHRSARCPA